MNANTNKIEKLVVFIFWRFTFFTSKCTRSVFK
jgi:hypothetical protein